MTTTITVRETTEHRQAPECGTARLSIESHGHSKAHVHDWVQATLDILRTQIETMRDDHNGPVTWHSVSNVRTWSWKNKDGQVLFEESVDVRVKFKDFAVLGKWLGDVLRRDGVRLRHIDWTITQSHKDRLLIDLRQRAVRMAREKANQYASAIGLHVVAVEAIADVGLLKPLAPTGLPGDAIAASRASMSADLGPASSDSYRLSPEDVLLTAAVDAQFLAE